MPALAEKPRRTISVCSPVLDGAERRYALDCIDTNWISSLGEYIPRFEHRFAGLCGAAHGVACSSGTAALHLVLEALDIGPDDEVLIPSFTLIVSANVVCRTGATPVLVDVRPDTWCIDPSLMEARITSRTKAIMAVHMYGHPCDMNAICDIARRHGLYVIEDAAQAHGATYRGRTVGSIGEVGCFSFYANKIITTGEGGMVVTNDAAIAERAALLRNQAFGEERFVHHHVGFNYRMTNIQAAIGYAQCERFDEKVARKREIAAEYDRLLSDQDALQLPARADGCEPVYWMYGVVLRDEFGRTKREVRDRLAAAGIETRSFFVPMNRQPVFQGGHRRWPDLRGSFPVSEWLGECGFYLPSGLDLTPDDQAYIVERLRACKG
ncbi:MAG: DegT/DnrJ/EryC1/StrS family aminotransferase [Phycisphaerales bacterium]|nr:DegT/DnrJ/EryC1/StrS family aminotransferase [Phycisphaerales bacterium]